MAQTIIGLDIGSYSVKVASLTTSFRSVAWTGFREIVIPREQREKPENVAAEVLTELAKDPKTKSAVVVSALPGDRAMTRFVTFPFSDPKRIESVLGFELQNRVPLTIAEMVYTFQVAGPADGGKTEVFAAACKKTTLEQYLSAVSGAGLDPRIVTLDTASYLNLYDQLVKSGSAAFIDIGHKTTKVCIVKDGRLALARSVGRGGLAVTRSIQQALGCDFDTAERTKHEHGAMALGAGHGGPPPTPLARACNEALQPLVMSLRQTFQASLGERGVEVERVFVTGGGSQIENLIPWLESELGQSVERLPVERLEINRVPNLTHADVAAKGVGLALVQAAASKHRTTLDFRRGEFAYAGDFEFLQDRLRSLTAMAAILIIVGSGWAVAKNQGLERQLEEQRNQLGEFTEATLGQKMTSFTKTLKTLEAPPTQAGDQDLFPPMTAIVVLDTITAIQSELNQVGVQPGGPGDPLLPPGHPGLAPGRLPATRAGLEPARPIDPSLRQPEGLRTPRPMPVPANVPVIPPGASRPMPGAMPANPTPAMGPGAGDVAPVPPGAEGAEASGDPAAAGGRPAPAGQSNSKIELSNIDIDVFGDVTITAETHESNVNGKELFREKLEQQKCFKEVKRRDIGEVVSTGRHEDWVRFEVTLKIKCPKSGDDEAADADKKDAKGKPAKDKSGTDGKDAEGEP